MAGASPIDAVELAQALIRCESVTPAEGGALDLLEARLEAIGFTCHRLPFAAPGTPEVDNLYARHGRGQPNFCFAGHTDVVPVGARDRWRRDPFAGEIADGRLHGRGASDMKGAIGAFAAAAAGFLADRGEDFDGAISLLITGDEEGPAVNGTVRVLEWMAREGEHIDHCLVGEPTNPEELGEMIKNGRRGSLTGRLGVTGQQGHVAYPHLADNPAPRLIRMLAALDALALDDGNEHFQASNLEITTIDIANPASNVIPAEARATFNIRFNTEQTAEGLMATLRQTCAEVGGAHELELELGSEPFLTDAGPFTDLVQDAVEEALGRRPALSTTGGTSDARFIKNVCPVVEFGLVGQTMHKVDEHAAVGDIERLAHAYRRVLERYFGS